MNPNLSEIICIVDRSGSMEAIRTDAIGGFNAFLEEQKREPGQARLTLVLFDHEYLVPHQAAPLSNVPPLDASTYVPRGTTALLDAIGRTIDDVGVRLASARESERPAKVIVAILTDGYENASRDYTRDRIASMIRHQQEKYAWEFIFLAANQDAIQEAKSLSIAPQDAISFAATGAGVVAAYRAMSGQVRERRKPSPHA